MYTKLSLLLGVAAAAAACSHRETPVTTGADRTTVVATRADEPPRASLPPPEQSNMAEYRANPSSGTVPKRESAQNFSEGRAKSSAADVSERDSSEVRDWDGKETTRLTDSGNTTTAPAADDTGVNERDRDTTQPTPLNQGESEQDRKLTQQIRRALMSDDTLSFTAKNVKIITQNGKVTLRGPVNSASERSTIDNFARRIAGERAVINQLEVKP
ncbi:MAG: BON domain-containing protein [Myxococcota bacterium]